MKNKKVYIILDNLPRIEETIEPLKEKTPITFRKLLYSHFISKKISAELRNEDPLNLIILIEKNEWEKKSESLKNYLRELYTVYMPEIICLSYTLHSDWEESKYQQADKYFFIDPSDLNIFRSFNLLMYILRVFNEAKLNYRLCDYMSGSIQEIVNAEQLKMKNTEIKELNKQLEEKNKIDYLTNLYNRRAFYQVLNQHFQKAKEYIPEKTPQLPLDGVELPEGLIRRNFDTPDRFAVMMIDVDFFKKINDVHGHLVGDKVLKIMGHLLSSSRIFRNNDIAGRFGGEEFTLLLPATNAENAKSVAKRLMNSLKEVTFKGKGNNSFFITISIGIAEYRNEDTRVEDLLQRADTALYWVKNNGRNQVAIHTDSMG